MKNNRRRPLSFNRVSLRKYNLHWQFRCFHVMENKKIIKKKQKGKYLFSISRFKIHPLKKGCSRSIDESAKVLFNCFLNF